MATDIEIVRTIIADRYTYDHAEKPADGARSDFDLPNSPVKIDSEIVTINGVVQAKPADYTIANDVGVVTFTSVPAANALVVITYQWSILSDADLQIFIDVEADVKLASAGALDTIASSEALVQKVIRINDLSTDGAAVADALRAHAKALRDQVAVAVEVAGFGSFDWAEMVVDDATLLERLTKRAIAES